MATRHILYFEPLIPEFKQVLEENVPDGYKMWYWAEMSPKEQEDKLLQTDYFLVGGKAITADLIQKAVKLRHIQKTGAGYNKIDVKTADKLNIPVAALPGANGFAVAEHAVMMALALLRRLLEVDAETKAGNFPHYKYRPSSYEMYGKTVGFLGFGNIGRAASVRFKAFGTNIVYYDPFRATEQVERELQAAYLSKEEVLAKADIVSLHMPYTEENKNYIGKAELALMKKGAFLINVSRGGLVDEDALYEAMMSGHIAGIGIDNWTNEPCPASNPLFSLPNVIATPHVAGGTLDTYRRQVKGALDNILLAENNGTPKFTVGRVTTIRSIT